MNTTATTPPTDWLAALQSTLTAPASDAAPIPTRISEAPVLHRDAVIFPMDAPRVPYSGPSAPRPETERERGMALDAVLEEVRRGITDRVVSLRELAVLSRVSQRDIQSMLTGARRPANWQLHGLRRALCQIRDEREGQA
jgi:hypothetical protein